jgi:hypothetical protein
MPPLTAQPRRSRPGNQLELSRRALKAANIAKAAKHQGHRGVGSLGRDLKAAKAAKRQGHQGVCSLPEFGAGVGIGAASYPGTMESERAARLGSEMQVGTQTDGKERERACQPPCPGRMTLLAFCCEIRLGPVGRRAGPQLADRLFRVRVESHRDMRNLAPLPPCEPAAWRTRKRATRLGRPFCKRGAVRYGGVCVPAVVGVPDGVVICPPGACAGDGCPLPPACPPGPAVGCTAPAVPPCGP